MRCVHTPRAPHHRAVAGVVVVAVLLAGCGATSSSLQGKSIPGALGRRTTPLGVRVDASATIYRCGFSFRITSTPPGGRAKTYAFVRIERRPLALVVTDITRWGQLVLWGDALSGGTVVTWTLRGRVLDREHPASHLALLAAPPKVFGPRYVSGAWIEDPRFRLGQVTVTSGKQVTKVAVRSGAEQRPEAGVC